MIKTFLVPHINTHRVIFLDIAPDVQPQFVADVDGVFNGPASAGDVTATHQAGLQP